MSFSPALVKAFYATECDEEVFLLITLSGANIGTPIRLSTGYTERLRENDDEIIYGLRSRGNEFIWLPMEITLPSDEHGAAQTSQLLIHNVTRMLTPQLRGLNGTPNVLIELVVGSKLDAVEGAFSGFQLKGYTYNDSTVSGQLVVPSQDGEPFPQHCFTPNYFPGLF